MPRGIPRGGRNGVRPSLRFERIERAKQTYLMDTKVVELIGRYPAYVRATTGIEPKADEVVESAVRRVLNNDLGFKEWLSKQTGQESIVTP